jgi:hypothetical protein
VSLRFGRRMCRGTPSPGLLSFHVSTETDSTGGDRGSSYPLVARTTGRLDLNRIGKASTGICLKDLGVDFSGLIDHNHNIALPFKV